MIVESQTLIAGVNTGESTASLNVALSVKTGLRLMLLIPVNSSWAPL